MEAAARKWTWAPPGYVLTRMTAAEKKRIAASRSRSSAAGRVMGADGRSAAKASIAGTGSPVGSRRASSAG